MSDAQCLSSESCGVCNEGGADTRGGFAANPCTVAPVAVEEPVQAVILLYHRVSKIANDPFGLCVSPRHFVQHMRILRDCYRAMPLVQLHEALSADQLPPRALAVTFDDGYADNLHQAKPILQRYQVPATVFVATGLLDGADEIWSDELERLVFQPGRLPQRIQITIGQEIREWSLNGANRYPLWQRWRHRNWRFWYEVEPTSRHKMYRCLWNILRTLPAEQRHDIMLQLRSTVGLNAQARSSHRWLTVQELRTLAADPLLEIGGHTVTHSSLIHLPPQEQRQEIQGCKRRIQEILDQEITSFSYPFGSRSDFDGRSAQLVGEAGFQRACSNYGGAICPQADPFDLPRMVVHDWPGRVFADHLEQWFNGK